MQQKLELARREAEPGVQEMEPELMRAKREAERPSAAFFFSIFHPICQTICRAVVADQPDPVAEKLARKGCESLAWPVREPILVPLQALLELGNQGLGELSGLKLGPSVKLRSKCEERLKEEERAIAARQKEAEAEAEAWKARTGARRCGEACERDATRTNRPVDRAAAANMRVLSGRVKRSRVSLFADPGVVAFFGRDV